jgi:four helix bundle protein
MTHFKNLLVADKARELATEVISAQELRADDVLSELMCETAISVPALIARATVAESPAQFAIDIDPAVVAVFRLECQIHVAASIGLLPNQKRASLEARVEEVRKMLVALRESALRGFAASPRRRAKLKRV